MAKVFEYFQAGVRQVWVVYPKQQHPLVYESLTHIRGLTDADELDGGDILPGFRTPIAGIVPGGGRGHLISSHAATDDPSSPPALAGATSGRGRRDLTQQRRQRHAAAPPLPHLPAASIRPAPALALGLHRRRRGPAPRHAPHLNIRVLERCRQQRAPPISPSGATGPAAAAASRASTSLDRRRSAGRPILRSERSQGSVFAMACLLTVLSLPLLRTRQPRAPVCRAPVCPAPVLRRPVSNAATRTCRSARSPLQRPVCGR